MTRILVVEDDRAQAHLIKRILEIVGFEVQVALGSEEALSAAHADPPDLVLSDVVMPSMDGYELCRRIKQSETTQHVPVLLVSGLQEPSDVLRGLQCGADNFVLKPYDPSYLVSRVRAHLDPHASRNPSAPEHELSPVVVSGESFLIDAPRRKILDFLVSSFEDFHRAKAREHGRLRDEGARRVAAESARALQDAVDEEAASLERKGASSLKAAALAQALGDLQASERRFRQLAETTRVIPWEANLTSGLTYIGPQVQEILGYSGDDLLGRDLWKAILHPDDRERVATTAVTSSMKSWETEYRVLAADGESLWVRDHVSLVRGADGNRLLRGFMFDITALKEAETSAQEAQRFLTSALDALSQHIAVLDADGTIVTVNAAWRRFGRDNGLEDSSGGIGQNYFAHCERGGGDGRQVGEAIRNVLLGEIEVALLAYPCHAPSEKRWFELRVTRFGGPGPPRVVLAHEDVTVRWSAEEARRKSEARTGWLLQQLPIVVWSTDRDLRLTETAGGASDFESSAKTLAGKHLSEFCWKEGEDRVCLDAHRRALAGETVSFEETRSGRWWETVVAPLHSQRGGEVVGVSGLSIDVTTRMGAVAALEEKEQQLQQAVKMEAVGQLAGGIAHDFNNLLTAIGGYSKLITEQTDPRNRHHHYATQVTKATAQASTLTRQLLAFSRKQVLTPQVLDLREVIMDMIPLLRPLLGEGVSTSTEFHSDLSSVLADPAQIQQVIMNLAVNARDAMPAGGTLAFSTEDVAVNEVMAAALPSFVPGDYVRLTVSDTGAGMPPEVLEHLFEPFFTTKAKGKGTGLGLSTVYGIVKQSGGWVWVESTPGHGTSFSIYLPISTATTTPRSSRRDSGSSKNWRISAVTGGVVLLAEDEALVREYAREVLTNANYTVLDSLTPEHAISLAKEHAETIDLLLTDVVMPGMNGAQLAARVREMCPGIRVLYMSGHTGEVLFGKGLLLPDAPLLPKPFSPTDLISKVHAAIDGSE